MRVGTGTMLLRAGDGTATFPPGRNPVRVGVGVGVGNPDLDVDGDLGDVEMRPPRSWVTRGR